MIHKKWFTLLEMSLVIVVLSIIIFMMKPFFESNKKDYLYIESCANKVYGDMNNFMYAAATSKGLGTGINKIFPDQYIIKVINTNLISLEYQKSDGTTWSQIQDYLTWLKDYYCYSNTYTSKFSWDFFTLTINKWSSATNGNTQSYTITWTQNNPAFTWAISLYLCYANTVCREVAKFEIDTRIQTIKKKKCLTLNEFYWACQSRDQ